ncbi:MAG TPA: hypothetical protein VH639_16600 [Bryobacteraceae bacterium]
MRASGHPGATLGLVSDISDAGIVLGLPLDLAADETVELEMADSVVYGRVICSVPRNSSFQSVIEVWRVALGATELSRMLQRILLEALPDAKGLDSPAPEFD